MLFIFSLRAVPSQGGPAVVVVLDVVDLDTSKRLLVQLTCSYEALVASPAVTTELSRNSYNEFQASTAQSKGVMKTSILVKKLIFQICPSPGRTPQ